MSRLDTVSSQRKDLRARLIIDESAKRLANFFNASVDLMKVLARACEYTSLNQFNKDNVTTFKRDMASLTGIHYGGDPEL
ncbi:MAG: hypothetical protein E2O67_04520 [Deltaproteobacteria bacterium]|nr:MAG: hypothetical protein E2O67_04520 [Deltaproteobacteria bacterium]